MAQPSPRPRPARGSGCGSAVVPCVLLVVYQEYHTYLPVYGLVLLCNLLKSPARSRCTLVDRPSPRLPPVPRPPGPQSLLPRTGTSRTTALRFLPVGTGPGAGTGTGATGAVFTDERRTPKENDRGRRVVRGGACAAPRVPGAATAVAGSRGRRYALAFALK